VKLRVFSEREVIDFGNFLVAYFMVTRSHADIGEFVEEALEIFMKGRESRDAALK
jgi:hypothetical protein